MTGLLAFSIASSTSGRVGGLGGLPNSEMSAPAMKVRPAQISTIALTAPFASAASRPRLIPSRTFAESAFTGGELILTVAISPSISSSVTALMAVIVCP